MYLDVVVCKKHKPFLDIFYAQNLSPELQLERMSL